MKRYWQFHARGEQAVLWIEGEIGSSGVQAKEFRAALAATPGAALTVEINSPGGDVFAGLAIYNMLRASGKTITTRVTAIAASAASLVMLAGDVREMPEDTYVFLHNPWSEMAGTADEMRETAAVLDKIGESLATTYAARTGLSEAKVHALLTADTLLTASEARTLGFATKVTAPIDAWARLGPLQANLPDKVRALLRAPVAPPRSVATSEREIQALCAFANRPQAAAEFIAAGTPLSQVRAELLTGLSAANSTSAIWDRHHNQGKK